MKFLILTISAFTLWNYREARVNTANFLRSTADFLSPIEKPIKSINRQR